jgi:hypothetical protein
MRTITFVLMALLSFSAVSKETATIHPTNSKGAVMYHKPYLTVVKGTVYQTTPNGAVQYHKPVAAVSTSKGKSNAK